MSTYAVYCIKNPCSYQTGKWTTYSYDSGWQSNKPERGTDLNSAYRCLEALNNMHVVAKKCECKFDVIELGD